MQKQTVHEFRHGSSAIKYLLYIPPEYEEKNEKFSLILFLHGVGESGKDIEKVKRHGIAKVVEEKDMPFITVSPQNPGNDWGVLTEILLSLIDDVLGNYRVDKERIYLTGLSIGGRGTWQLAMENPGRFAAIAPICGDIPKIPTEKEFMDNIDKIKEIPTWVFHGDQDEVIPVENSRMIVRELRNVGANVRYTEYPGVDHDSWTKTYENSELYAWLLENTL